MTSDEVRREAWEDQGRPEVVGERERLARQILEGGVPDVVLVASDGAAVVLGRRGGQGSPRVVARVPSPASLPYVATLRGRGVPVATEPLIARALEGVRPGQDVPRSLLDPLAALYRRLGVGAATSTRGGRE
jgi:type III secretory pathway component EscU